MHSLGEAQSQCLGAVALSTFTRADGSLSRPDALRRPRPHRSSMSAGDTVPDATPRQRGPPSLIGNDSLSGPAGEPAVPHLLAFRQLGDHRGLPLALDAGIGIDQISRLNRILGELDVEGTHLLGGIPTSIIRDRTENGALCEVIVSSSAGLWAPVSTREEAQSGEGFSRHRMPAVLHDLSRYPLALFRHEPTLPFE